MDNRYCQINIKNSELPDAWPRRQDVDRLTKSLYSQVPNYYPVIPALSPSNTLYSDLTSYSPLKNQFKPWPLTDRHPVEPEKSYPLKFPQPNMADYTSQEPIKYGFRTVPYFKNHRSK